MNGMPPSRSVLVLGASRGIGAAVCRRLTAAGHEVIGVARHFPPDRLPDASRESAFTPVTLDLADLDNLPRRLLALQREHPRIDTLVCCAGRGRFGCLEEFSCDQIRALMEINFLAHAFAVRTFLPTMKSRGDGLLVFIGSEAALAGHQKGSIYCASKFALRGFAQALREECARSGVRVTVINPGMVRTGFFADLDFAPGPEPEHALRAEDVAEAVALAVAAPPTGVVDEINLSPLKKVVIFRKED